MESLGLRATAAPAFLYAVGETKGKKSGVYFCFYYKIRLIKEKNIVLFVAEREIFLYLCYCFNAGSIRRLPLVSEMV